MLPQPVNDNIIRHVFNKAKHDRDTAFSLVFLPLFSITCLVCLLSVVALIISITSLLYAGKLQTKAVYIDSETEKNNVEIEALKQLVLEERRDAVGNDRRDPL